MHKIQYRTIFISDVHLGAREAQSEYLLDFLRHMESDHLYLIGDIFDLWKARSGCYWPQINNEIIQLILHKARHGTRIIYIPGNHDERLRDYIGAIFNDIIIAKDHIHETANGKKLLLIHGDEFDCMVSTSAWLACLGSFGYSICLWLNRHFNYCRRKLGFPYWSLSSHLKGKLKNAMTHIARFEQASVTEAARHGVDGVVCGHIHHVNIDTINGMLYCNTGDWVENCTAIAEDANGDLSIIRWVEDGFRLLANEEVRLTRGVDQSIPSKAA